MFLDSKTKPKELNIEYLSTINIIHKRDNKYFQYAVTVALNYENAKKDAQRIRKIEPFINKYKWEGKHFHQKKMIGKIWEKQSNIAVNVLYAEKRKT